MKKLLLGVCLFLSATLALAQMPRETRQAVLHAMQQKNYVQAVQLLRPWCDVLRWSRRRAGLRQGTRMV